MESLNHQMYLYEYSVFYFLYAVSNKVLRNCTNARLLADGVVQDDFVLFTINIVEVLLKR